MSAVIWSSQHNTAPSSLTTLTALARRTLEPEFVKRNLFASDLQAVPLDRGRGAALMPRHCPNLRLESSGSLRLYAHDTAVVSQRVPAFEGRDVKEAERGENIGMCWRQRACA